MTSDAIVGAPRTCFSFACHVNHQPRILQSFEYDSRRIVCGVVVLCTNLELVASIQTLPRGWITAYCSRGDVTSQVASLQKLRRYHLPKSYLHNCTTEGEGEVIGTGIIEDIESHSRYSRVECRGEICDHSAKFELTCVRCHLARRRCRSPKAKDLHRRACRL
jgi:hypothetical protein